MTRLPASLALCALALLAISPAAHADIDAKDNGLYTETVSAGFRGAGSGIVYLVDSVARICFAKQSGVIAVIPCESLARRPGWAEILTWVETLPPSSPPEKP